MKIISHQSLVISHQLKIPNSLFVFFSGALVLWCSGALFQGCTVKAVGDPNRPITINAHVTIDIRGMKETATNIEDFVSGETTELKTKSGEQK